MKVRIVDASELKKTPQQREAEAILKQLIDSKDRGKAIEVTLGRNETPRKINRIFRKAALAYSAEIKTRRKDDKIIIKLK